MTDAIVEACAEAVAALIASEVGGPSFSEYQPGEQENVRKLVRCVLETAGFDAAEAALIKASDIAMDYAEGCSEEAQQAHAERDEKAEREFCARMNSFHKITNAMQPALGAALRRARALSQPTKE